MQSTPSRGVRTVVAVAVTLAVAAPPLRAQAPGSPAPAPAMIGEVQLFGEEDVKIEAATKTSIPISKAPGAVSVITARQIRESGARTIPDLLRLVPGVNVRWNPMVETIDMRGFGENPFTNRVLLLIDGVPYNDWNQGGFPQHPGLDFFVLQNVKRVEVVRGPGSSLYGENAFWGVINIVTLSGEDLQGGRLEAFGGDRHTASGSAFYGKKFGEGSVFASVKYLQSRLPMEFWLENESDWKGNDVFLKATYKGLQASYYRHQDEMEGFSEPLPIPGLPPTAAFTSAAEVGQTVNIAALRYDHQPKEKKVGFTATASYATRFGTHCAACHAAKEKPAYSIKEDHGYQLLGDMRMNFRGLKHNDLLIGVESRFVDRGAHASELSDDPLKIDTYSKLAAYIQDQLSVWNDKAIVTAGLRYDAKTDFFDEKLSPRVALVLNPVEPLVLRAGWSTAFRFPNFSELSQASWFINADVGFPLFPGGPSSFPIATFRPNQRLEPEESRTLEAGAEYRFSPNLSGKVDVFRSRLDKFLVLAFGLAPPPAVPSLGFENQTDDATITGFETELRWNVTGKTTGFVNYSHQKNEQNGTARDSGGQMFEFVYAPEHKVNVGAYLGPFSGVRLAGELSWRGERVAPATWGFVAGGAEDPSLLFTPVPLESYALLDARVSYDLPFDLGKQKRPLRLTVHGRNLLDEKVKETFIGVDTTIPGRELFAEVSIDLK